MPLVGQVIEILCINPREELERARIAAPCQAEGRGERVGARSALVQLARLDQLRIPGGGSFGITAREESPTGKQRRGLYLAFLIRQQIVDGPFGTLDQGRPLQERGRGPRGQRFREISRELWPAVRKRHACASLDEFGSQEVARPEPVERRIASIGETARREPLLGDGLFKAVVAAERGAGGKSVTAQRDIGVDGVVVVLQISFPLPASAKIREPRAAQAADIGLRAVPREELGDRSVCAEVVLEPRRLQIRIERIRAQRVVVRGRRAGAADLCRSVGYAKSGADRRVLVRARTPGRRKRGDHECAGPAEHRPECTCGPPVPAVRCRRRQRSPTLSAPSINVAQSSDPPPPPPDDDGGGADPPST